MASSDLSRSPYEDPTTDPEVLMQVVSSSTARSEDVVAALANPNLPLERLEADLRDAQVGYRILLNVMRPHGAEALLSNGALTFLALTDRRIADSLLSYTLVGEVAAALRERIDQFEPTNLDDSFASELEEFLRWAGMEDDYRSAASNALSLYRTARYYQYDETEGFERGLRNMLSSLVHDLAQWEVSGAKRARFVLQLLTELVRVLKTEPDAIVAMPSFRSLQLMSQDRG